MGGDFVICVDNIVASACLSSGELAAGIGGGDPALPPVAAVEVDGMVNKKGGSFKEMVECRICQEEGVDGDFESPCACNGTLKFAHRKCIQKWCNKKGNITCEICNQVFAPNYSLPPSKNSIDMLTIDIRQSWGLHDPRYLAFAAAERELLSAEYEEAAANSSGIACCRTVALTLMLLVLFCHILMVTRDSGIVQDASTVFNVSLLQFAGFLLPCYAVARCCYIL